MRISDWSSDVCSSDLFPDAAGSRSSGAPVRPWPRTGRNSAAFRAEPALHRRLDRQRQFMPAFIRDESRPRAAGAGEIGFRLLELVARDHIVELAPAEEDRLVEQAVVRQVAVRSDEHTSELQSLMRISYAVFCLKKKKTQRLERRSNHKARTTTRIFQTHTAI